MKNRCLAKGSLLSNLCFILTLFPCFVFADVWEPVANGINGNDTALAPKIFAQELFGDGSVRIAPGFATYNLGATVNENVVAKFIIRGGTWGTALTSASLTLDDVDGSGSSASILLIEGGRLDDSSASFRLDVSSQLTSGDELTLNYDLDDTFRLARTEPPFLPITLEINLSDDVGKFSVDDGPSIVAESVDAVSLVSSTGGLSGGIDYLNNLTTFSETPNPLEVKLLVFSIVDGDAGSSGLEDDGITSFNLQSGDVSINSGQIEITGSFSASLSGEQDSDDLTNVGLRLAGCIDRPTSSLTSSLAIFDLTGDEILAMKSGGPCSLIMKVNGITPIEEFIGEIVFFIDYKNSSYLDEELTALLYEVSINSVGTAFLNLLVPQEAGFSHSVRIFNKGVLAGKIFGTLYNDQGGSVTFELLKQPLPASGSKMLTVEEIYQGARSRDPSFSPEGGKLRLRLNSDVPISAKSYIISTDNSTFSRI